MLELHRDCRHLIIGGTTKAATTSLFNYLAAHPKVCASSLKETRFFIDIDYPELPLNSHWTDGYEKYEIFFRKVSGNENLKLEASPDYLYSAGTAQRIKDHLLKVKVIFIVRNPTDRIVSWFKFAKQLSYIPQEMKFQEYVQRQLDNIQLEDLSYFEQAKEQRRNGLKTIPPVFFFSALEHGCYAKYLRPYFELLGRENIKVLFYEDLSTSPYMVLEEICKFVEISSDFYESYQFKVFNRSKMLRNPALHNAYVQTIKRIRKRTNGLPIHRLLKKIRSLIEPIYSQINSSKSQEIEISRKTLDLLDDFYKPNVIELESLLGCRIPW